MQINKFTENVNIIQSLDNQPTISAEELKKKFDEASGMIKTYINDTLIPSVEDFSEDLETKLTQKIDSEVEELTTQVDTEIEEMTETVNKSLSDVEKEISNINQKVTVYGDFITKRYSKNLEINQGAPWNYDSNWDIALSNYVPLSIAGYSLEYYNGSNSISIEKLRINGDNISFKASSKNGVQYANLYVDVLYIKVK